MDHHTCPPRWECVNADEVDYADGENIWYKVYARDAKEAAEKFSEWGDDGAWGYPSEREVAVRAADGTIEVYNVVLESMPVYTASKKSR